MKTGVASYRQLFGPYLAAQRRAVALLLALILANVGLSLLYPEIMRSFLDRATAGAAEHTLVALAALFIAAAVISQFVSVAAIYVGEQVAWRTTNRLRADLVLHCLRLPMPFHHDHTPGALIERIDGDVTAVSNLFSQLAISLLSSGLLLLGILVLLFREDWRAGVALSVLVLIAVVVVTRTRAAAVPYLAAERQAYAELYGFLEERLAGVDDIRANGAGGYVMRRFFETHRQVYQRAVAAAKAVAWLVTSTIGLYALGSVTMLAVGGYLYQRHDVTLGVVYLIFQYVQLLRRPLEQISQQLREVQKAGAGIGRVVNLNTRPTERSTGTSALPAGPLSVEFDGVTFGYRTDATVLHNVSFSLRPGEVLGLLGRTGSGKTTIGRLLVRLYEPGSGAIRLGGVDAGGLDLAELRREVAIVTQDVQLFEASLRENLTFFDASISDQRIEAALAELGLDVWLRSLSRGLDTELGPGGQGLSAGESQLVAFARVLLRYPRVVVLDEAASRVDPATERLIVGAVQRLLAGRTGIIIAHRLDSVARVDRVIVLDGGRVAESGERRTLLADAGSRYSRLLRTGLTEVPIR